MMIKDLLNDSMITLDILDSDIIYKKWRYVIKEAYESDDE